MTEKICHKLINENIKTLCYETLGNANNNETKNENSNYFMNTNCCTKFEELCNNINDRLQKIKDIVHLRSAKPNAILIETLNYIKIYLNEIEKQIEMFNHIIYEENKMYDYMENIFKSLDMQNENIQKIYYICSKNIVITKNNSELTLPKPQMCPSLSNQFVNNLISVCKEENETNTLNPSDETIEIQDERHNNS
ncbi:conserved protein, unknown function [Hepatocystis sp. ex Piliocolobus tephrosceles]|nr:conserved protein, unknown function [Hepatocystis sp. ex Piliocolobus tephrosceles]